MPDPTQTAKTRTPAWGFRMRHRNRRRIEFAVPMTTFDAKGLSTVGRLPEPLVSRFIDPTPFDHRSLASCFRQFVNDEQTTSDGGVPNSERVPHFGRSFRGVKKRHQRALSRVGLGYSID